MALRRLAEVAQNLIEIKMYRVYAIYNKKHNKIYVGQTINLEERLVLHNQHVFRGYTAQFDGLWTLIYSEDLPTRLLALRREKQLKSYRGRQFVKSHIPGWRSGSAARC